MQRIYKAKDEIGSWLQSNIMIACDPCYKREYEPTLFNRFEVVSGVWDAYCYYLGGRVAKLEAKLHGSTSTEYKTLAEDAGVDSGQFGFFDDSIFPNNEFRDFDDKNSFYGICCDLTLGKKQAGIVMGKGVVSSSGFGDGSYRVTIGKNILGKTNSVNVEFISEEDF